MYNRDRLPGDRRSHTSGVYAKRPVTIVRGEASTLWDEQGRAYIDCAAGHGVVNLGHCHPAAGRRDSGAGRDVAHLP